MRFAFYTVVSIAATIAHGIRLESEQNVDPAAQLLAKAAEANPVVKPVKPPMTVTTDGGFNNFKFDNANPEQVKKFMGDMAPKCPCA